MVAGRDVTRIKVSSAIYYVLFLKETCDTKGSPQQRDTSCTFWNWSGGQIGKNYLHLIYIWRINFKYYRDFVIPLPIMEILSGFCWAQQMQKYDQFLKIRWLQCLVVAEIPSYNTYIMNNLLYNTIYPRYTPPLYQLVLYIIKILLVKVFVR